MSEPPSTAARLPAIFAGRSLNRAVTLLAWPIIVENVFQSFVGLIDLMLVGQLGSVAVAAVGTATQLVWLFISVTSAISVGATVMIAQALGRRDEATANHVTRQALLLSLLVGGLLALLAPMSEIIIGALGPEAAVVEQGGAYLRINLFSFFLVAAMLVCSACLRGAGDSRTPMIVTGGMNIVHAVAAYLLMFGIGGWSGLGLMGSAWAAVVARSLGLLVLLLLMAGRNGRLSIAGRAGWRPDLALIGQLLRLGIPSSLEQFILSGGFLLYTAMVIPLGTVVFATQRITFNLMSLSFMPGMGYGMAATTLTGQALGAGRPDLARRSSYIALAQGATLMTAGGLLFFFAGEPLMRLFTRDPEIIALGAEGLKILAIVQPFWALGQVMSGSLRGGGDTRYPMWVTLIGMWLLRIPFGWFFGLYLGGGLPGVYISSLFDGACRGLLNWRRFQRAEWLRSPPTTAPTRAPVGADD